MARTIAALIAGAVFALGLSLAGMTQPSKVVGFLNFTQNWDPSLAFVMGGAILCFAPGLLWLRRLPTQAFGQQLNLPTSRIIDKRLLIGAALFGIGWGLGGLCPGPALVVAGTGATDAILFVLAMMGGMVLVPLVTARKL